MTPAEYINQTVGKPWSEFAQGPDAFDCYGLVLDSFDKIDGITLAEVKGYTKGYRSQRPLIEREIAGGGWHLSQPCNGAVMVTFENGRPRHVGRCLCGGVLHSGGGADEKTCGKVVWETYQQINMRFMDVRYYAPNPSS